MRRGVLLRIIALVSVSAVLAIVGTKAASRAPSSMVALSFDLKQPYAGHHQVSPAVAIPPFTISSYNCGGISDHYDYLRAVMMQKVMQERYAAEPEEMSLNEKIQALALKMLFASPSVREAAGQEWEEKGYSSLIEHLSATPLERGSPNAAWHQNVNQKISTYKERPIVIRDEQVKKRLDAYLGVRNEDEFKKRLDEKINQMAISILTYELPYDILCFQEADYLDPSMLPAHYDVLFSQTEHSVNGVAWNKERFDLVRPIGNILGRAFAVHLEDNLSGKQLLVASGHFSGSNPYTVEYSETGLPDSARGDAEIQALLELFDEIEADYKLIGMDSNVTPLHPRLNLFVEDGYALDAENFIEPTCANPYQVLNTRIDYIVLKGEGASIVNIPVSGVGLNSMQTNMSDHKPIAAKIYYTDRN